MKKVVAIDFDGTMYCGGDEDKEIGLWLTVTSAFRLAGWEPIIATMRAVASPDGHRVHRYADACGLSIIWCHGYPDKNAAVVAAGWPAPALWVDDAPEVCRTIPHLCKMCGEVEK